MAAQGTTLLRRMPLRRDRLAVMTFILIIVTLAYLIYHLLRFAFNPQPEKPTKPISTVGLIPSVVYYPSTTTTEAPTTTTTAVQRTTTTRANRGTRRSTESGHDFWWNLANCESEVGRTSRNIFQFSSDTASKVGIDGSEPYDTQKAAAIAWAARIHPREASSSGWPTCWAVALAST